MTPHEVLALYQEGAFPMADERGKIRVYRYDPRAILPLESFHVPRRMVRELRQANFEIHINRDCPAVIKACSQRRHTWLSPKLVRVYTQLHRLGYVHSVEAWKDGKLAGGLYGVALGAAFCGESMFHHLPSASKACLVALVERLKARDFRLLDCQEATLHTARFGIQEIPLEAYLQLLDVAIQLPRKFCDEKESEVR